MLRPLVLLCALWSPLAGAAALTAVTEESAPYHFTRDGKVVGIATDYLLAACKLAAIDCKVVMLPWARAYSQAKNQPDTLIFSIVRRSALENEFIWVSPIITEGMWLYGRADASVPASLKDVHQQRIGAINGGSAIAVLKQKGVPASAIDAANSIELNHKKFAAGRVDYIINTEHRIGTELERFPLPFKVRKMLKLGEVTTYFAMNLHSDPATVRALRAALDKLRANKTLEQITRQYVAPE
jgi:polar amino acid transport system substrate-binding protein